MAKGFRFAEYRYFYEVANSRSMRKAAEALHVSPSALSRQIKKIEELLGSQVIERGGEGIRLTTSGELLLQHVRQSFSNEERLIAQLDEISGLRRGRVRIACGDSFASDLLSIPLEGFARKYPGITFNIMVVGTDGIVKMIVEEEAELGMILYPPTDERISTLTRCCQPLHAIMSPRHVLAKNKNVSLRQVNKYPLALPSYAHGVRQVTSIVAHEEKIQLAPRFSCNSILVLKTFAERYDAITILPKFAAMPELAAGRLSAVPLSEDRFRTTEVELIAKHARELPLASVELARVLAAGMCAFAKAK